MTDDLNVMADWLLACGVCRGLSVITQIDGPMITMDDGQRSHRGA